jgi:hypothetical protein
MLLEIILQLNYASIFHPIATIAASQAYNPLPLLVDFFRIIRPIEQ